MSEDPASDIDATSTPVLTMPERLDLLKPMQRTWLLAYLGEARANATLAARMAGYKHPEQDGHKTKRRLEKAGVLDPLHVANPAIADPAEVQAFWTDTMRGNIKEEVIIRVDGKATTMEKTAAPRDRLHASELLAKVNGHLRGGGVRVTSDDGRVVIEMLMPDNGR